MMIIMMGLSRKVVRFGVVFCQMCGKMGEKGSDMEEDGF